MPVFKHHFRVQTLARGLGCAGLRVSPFMACGLTWTTPAQLTTLSTATAQYLTLMRSLRTYCNPWRSCGLAIAPVGPSSYASHCSARTFACTSNCKTPLCRRRMPSSRLLRMEVVGFGRKSSSCLGASASHAWDCSSSVSTIPAEGWPGNKTILKHAWACFAHHRLCDCAANECFWSHEWSCHGSCSGWNQHDYFSNTINLHNNNDIAVSAKISLLAPCPQKALLSTFNSTAKGSADIPYDCHSQ